MLRYLVVELLPLVESPELLGDVVLDELELGRLLELELELGLELEELGEAVLPEAPELELELEPDLLKYASHSARETMPSLFVSTVEKLGELVVPDELPEALDGVLVLSDDDEDGVLDDEDDGEDDEDEDDWATASVDSAKSTAALRMLRVLGIT